MGLSVIASIDPTEAAKLAGIAGGCLAAFYAALKSHGQGKSAKRVEEQLQPNGGSSIKDQLNRIEHGIRWGMVKEKIIIDASGIAGFTTDDAGLCIHVSSAYLTMVERSQEDVSGTGWTQCVHADDRTRVWNEWSLAVQNQRVFDLTFRYVGADSGDVHPCRVKALPVKTTAGTFLGFEGYAVPVEAKC